jgi:hypothetical protein
MPGLGLVCNAARMGNCDFGGGWGVTTRPKDHLDSYTSPHTRKVRDQFKILYAATAEHASKLWAGSPGSLGRVSRAAKPPHLPTPQRLYTSPIGRCRCPHASYSHTKRGPSKDRLSANRSQPISPSYSLPPGLLPEPKNTIYRYWRL